MFGLTILDLVLVVALLSYLIHGLRNGFLVTLGGIAGFAAGAVAAFVSVPIVSGLVEDSGWRLTAIIATAVLLMMLGHGLGTAIGRRVTVIRADYGGGRWHKYRIQAQETMEPYVFGHDADIKV